jgi:hypothetical protein
MYRMAIVIFGSVSDATDNSTTRTENYPSNSMSSRGSGKTTHGARDVLHSGAG